MAFFEMFSDNPGAFIPALAIGGGLFVGIVGIISNAVVQSIRAKAAEHSRREIAAYIAEGSMTPAEGERLLAANVRG